MTTDNPERAHPPARTAPEIAPAREGRRPPSPIRTAINRQAHALALEFEKQERDRLTAHYWQGCKLADDLGQR